MTEVCKCWRARWYRGEAVMRGLSFEVLPGWSFSGPSFEVRAWWLTVEGPLPAFMKPMLQRREEKKWGAREIAFWKKEGGSK